MVVSHTPLLLSVPYVAIAALCCSRIAPARGHWKPMRSPSSTEEAGWYYRVRPSEDVITACIARTCTTSVVVTIAGIQRIQSFQHARLLSMQD